MMVSSKGRYALRVMIYLAQNDREELIPLKEIAEKSKYIHEVFRDDREPASQRQYAYKWTREKRRISSGAKAV